MAGSDDATRIRIGIGAELQRAESLLQRMTEAEKKLRKPHLCHVCKTKTREEE